MLNGRNIFSNLFLFIITVGIISTLGLVACGGGENGSESAQKETEQTAEKMDDSQPRVIEIEGLDSLKFSVTEITAKPGEEITVKLINNSSMPASAMSHNFVLLKPGTDPKAFNDKVLSQSKDGTIPEELNPMVIADSGLVAGGEMKSVTFTVPEEPGEYTYICTFPGHFAAGMKGTLTVKQ